MKFIIGIILSFLSISLYSQTYFKNTNHEVCMELYITNSGVGDYIVYLVIDETLDSTDYKIMKKWSTLTSEEKSRCSQHWAQIGKRVESENYPCYQEKLDSNYFKPKKVPHLKSR
jgi:hypothetical protein